MCSPFSERHCEPSKFPHAHDDNKTRQCAGHSSELETSRLRAFLGFLLVLVFNKRSADSKSTPFVSGKRGLFRADCSGGEHSVTWLASETSWASMLTGSKTPLFLGCRLWIFSSTKYVIKSSLETKTTFWTENCLELTEFMTPISISCGKSAWVPA